MIVVDGDVDADGYRDNDVSIREESGLVDDYGVEPKTPCYYACAFTPKTQRGTIDPNDDK